jgi:glycosyltransferase involved in cell wall biosynthesis
MSAKIAIIVQRYGVKVNGGAEVHARMLAEHLATKYDVTVLTSRAVEYTTWQPEYPAGLSSENGIKVLRFDNEPRQSVKLQRYYGRKVRGRHWVQKLHRSMGYPNWWEKLFPQATITDADSVKWLEAQGPKMPALLTYLQENINEYDAFIFFTALYYPTAMGILAAPQKSILVPTMHDEKASYFPIYQRVMAAAKWIMFNTDAEKKFSENLFSIQHVNKRVVGIGIDILKDIVQPDSSVLAKYKINVPYIIYVGRVDKNKGCDVLLDYFIRFVKEENSNVKLVMVGKNLMDTDKVNHPSVVMTGFANDEDKNQLLLQAEALVIPSFYESLSLVLLESFACGHPVLANGKTEVLKDHIDKSNGGWAYFNYNDFKQALHELLTNEHSKLTKGAAGYAYVKSQYSWQKVTQDFDEAIEDVRTGKYIE